MKKNVPVFDDDDVGGETDESNDGGVQLEVLSDSSLSSKKQKYVPGYVEKEIAEILKGMAERDREDLLPKVEEVRFDMFRERLEKNCELLHVTECGFPLDNQFFIDLATSKEWVNTLQMEVLMSFWGRRHAEILREGRSVFATPWLVSHVVGKDRKFYAAKNKTRVGWGERIKEIATAEGAEWYNDVDTVYVPMNWADKHWVGLVINLRIWSIEVMDPFVRRGEEAKIKRFVQPIADMLPYIVCRFCKPEASQSRGLEPFGIRRATGIYQNDRSGDCGPVAMKFLEMHGVGESYETLK